MSNETYREDNNYVPAYTPGWVQNARQWRELGYLAFGAGLAPSYAYGIYERAVRSGLLPSGPGEQAWTFQGRQQYYQGRLAANLGGGGFWGAYYQGRYGELDAATARYTGEVGAGGLYGAQRNAANLAYWQFQQTFTPASIGWGAARLVSYGVPEAWPMRAFGYGPFEFAQRALGANMVAPYMRGLPQEQAQWTSAWWMGQPRTWQEIREQSLGRWTGAQVGMWGVEAFVRGGVQGGLGAGAVGAIGAVAGVAGVSMMQPGLDIYAGNLAALYTRETWGMPINRETMESVQQQNRMAGGFLGAGIGYQMGYGSTGAPREYGGGMGRLAELGVTIPAYFAGQYLTQQAYRAFNLPPEYEAITSFIGGQLTSVLASEALRQVAPSIFRSAASASSGAGAFEAIQNIANAAGVGNISGMQIGAGRIWEFSTPITEDVVKNLLETRWDRLGIKDITLGGATPQYAGDVTLIRGGGFTEMPNVIQPQELIRGRYGRTEIIRQEVFSGAAAERAFADVFRGGFRSFSGAERQALLEYAGEARGAGVEEFQFGFEGLTARYVPTLSERLSEVGRRATGGLLMAGVGVGGAILGGEAMAWGAKQFGATPFQQEASRFAGNILGATGATYAASNLLVAKFGAAAMAKYGVGVISLGGAGGALASLLPMAVGAVAIGLTSELALIALGQQTVEQFRDKYAPILDPLEKSLRESTARAEGVRTRFFNEPWFDEVTTGLPPERVDYRAAIAKFGDNATEMAGRASGVVSRMWVGVNEMFRAASSIVTGSSFVKTERSALYSMAYTGVSSALAAGQVASDNISKLLLDYQQKSWDYTSTLPLGVRADLFGGGVVPPGGLPSEQLSQSWSLLAEVALLNGTKLTGEAAKYMNPIISAGVIDEGYSYNKNALERVRADIEYGPARAQQIAAMRETISWGAFVDPSLNTLSYDERSKVAGIMGRGLDVSFLAGQVTGGKMSIELYDSMVKAITEGGAASVDKWEAMRLAGISENEIDRQKYSEGIMEKTGYRREVDQVTGEGLWIAPGERSLADTRALYESWAGVDTGAPRGSGSQDRPPSVPAQHGLSRLVTRPTRLLVAESGAEVVSVTPAASAEAQSGGVSLDEVKDVLRGMLSEIAPVASYGILAATESKMESFMAKNLRRARSARGA